MSNLELIIEQAKNKNLSNEEMVKQSEIYDDIKTICCCKFQGVTRYSNCTARDIFEMESLGLNYTIV